MVSFVLTLLFIYYSEKFLLPCFATDDSPIPVLISEPPTPQITLKGENVSLQCVADSTANIDVVIDWRKDNRVSQINTVSYIPIKYNIIPYIYITVRGSTLHVKI